MRFGKPPAIAQPVGHSKMMNAAIIVLILDFDFRYSRNRGRAFGYWNKEK